MGVGLGELSPGSVCRNESHCYSCLAKKFVRVNWCAMSEATRLSVIIRIKPSGYFTNPGKRAILGTENKGRRLERTKEK